MFYYKFSYNVTVNRSDEHFSGGRILVGNFLLKFQEYHIENSNFRLFFLPLENLAWLLTRQNVETML